MKRPPIQILAATAWLLSLCLGACAGSPGTDLSSPPAPEAERQGGGLTVVDALGRSVQFSEPPRRLVLAGRATLPVANTLYLFPEAGERVVGMTSGNQKPGDFLALVDPAFGEKTLLAPDAGPEQIAPLQPDAVVLKSFMAETLGQSLEALDIPVVYVELETPEQYFRDVETLGQLLGNPSRAHEITAFYQSQLDTIAQGLQGLEEGQKPRVLILQYSDKGGEVALSVPSASWIQTTEAELAGASPAWTEAAQGGGWTVVNLEQIAAWDADQIFVVDYGGRSSQVAESLLANPQWQALRAAEGGQIYGFPGDVYSWDQPDPRWILGVTWLAGRVHPDRFPDQDMTKEASRFFEEMYNMDGPAIEEHLVRLLTGDVR